MDTETGGKKMKQKIVPIEYVTKSTNDFPARYILFIFVISKPVRLMVLFLLLSSVVSLHKYAYNTYEKE